MKIVKASAGSGKTYRLSHTYIDYLLGSGDPWAYRHLLAVTFTNKATAEMKERILRDLKAASATDPRAYRYLVGILHDYSAFGVSTIDRFFQQTLRSFAREIGQFSAYQIELDKKSLVAEAVDRVLDSAGPQTPELLVWMRQYALECISRGDRVALDEGLAEMGTRLRSDEYRALCAQCGIVEQESFSKDRLRAVRSRCRSIITEFGKDAAALGMVPEKSGRYAYPKTKKALEAPGVHEFLDKRWCDYATALIVDSQLYALGVAREFTATFEALMKEKNVMPLDESNRLLRAIIDGSDAPFVYEKTGTRYAHYLLDEFQDTSRLQWDNFLPLLRDADASGDNLIVGDVKQSIYRWRDSDWRMLGHEVQQEFPNAEVESSVYNWRSAREIVRFNNGFFEYAAAAVGLSGMYDGVVQKPRCPEPQAGSVRVSFTSDQEAAVLESIADVRSRGAEYKDIAILVRGRKDGSRIAAALLEAGMPVISDDSLNLKNSVTVSRLVALLSCSDDPSNALGAYVSRETGITPPERFNSLVDYCERLLSALKDFDPAAFEADTLFVGAFMDRLQDWVGVNGNRLHEFLSDWNALEEAFTGSLGDSEAIRIMTIHKAKGLEFPHVIFPYADKVSLFQKETRWCRLSGAGSALGTVADGIYPVELSGSSARTLFAGAYEEERLMQTVDNINLFYVALTRASRSLHIIAKPLAKEKEKALSAGRAIDWSNFSEILYKFCGCNTAWSAGEPFDFAQRPPALPSSTLQLKVDWELYPIGGRLGPSPDAADYFAPDGATGADASPRLRGIGLHQALAEGIPAGLNPADKALLQERMAAHPEWFELPDSRNEVSVYDSDGSQYRPDRVVFRPDGGVDVVDYKFGSQKPSYIKQVRRYVDLYRRMGYSSVRGYVWYVPADLVVEV